MYLSGTFYVAFNLDQATVAVRAAELEHTIQIGLQFTESDCQGALYNHGVIADFLSE